MKKKSSAKNYYTSYRTEVKELIPDTVKTILDIGCGEATTWKGEKNFEITGIEIFFEVAINAKKNIKNIIVGNVEHLPLKNKKFDCLVFADILEHIYNPWETLNYLTKNFLKDNGYIIASIPNIQYYRVLKKIFSGKWEYSNSGILDFDHIRFFTYLSIINLLEKSNLTPLKIKRNYGGSKKVLKLNKILLGRLDNFLTKQFLILAKKK